MQIYPYDPSYPAGQAMTLCVQPDSRFCLQFYSLSGGAGIHIPSSMNNVTATYIDAVHKWVFTSGSSTNSQKYDSDWQWPSVTITMKFPPASGTYIACAYEVDANGQPTTDLGRRIRTRQAVYFYPPDSDSMALVVTTPPRGTSTAEIAYVIPIATYHAYNSAGGGCFYDDYVHGTVPHTRVTLRRPGGGLGAQTGQPTDDYDPVTPRQQYPHWDRKFALWLRDQGLACDYFTDLDLHGGILLNLARYKCMLSVGHHEYWSYAMRTNVQSFLTGGGNLAVFSGNTCFRPINFGTTHSSGFMNEINKLAENFPNYNESELLGLSYGYGGGQWGNWNKTTRRWENTQRPAYGYLVTNAEHWVFAETGLSNGETFGRTDYLVGYEADGMPSSSGFKALANSPTLFGFQENRGCAALGILGTEQSTGPKTGLVFNAGTTDWARLLEAGSARTTVRQITSNVLRAFTGT